MTERKQPDRSTDGIRLQKVLAAAGIGSRRACEELIAEGRVEVDGRIVREQGLRVDPEQAVIRVDGLHYSIPFAMKLAPILLQRAGIHPSS